MKMMMRNLRMELARRGLTQIDLSRELGLTPGTVSRKVSGGTFTLHEMRQIKQYLGTDMSMDDLFEQTERPARKRREKRCEKTDFGDFGD